MKIFCKSQLTQEHGSSTKMYLSIIKYIILNTLIILTFFIIENEENILYSSKISQKYKVVKS